MSGSLVALLATAVHQLRSTMDDPAELDRTVGLLARAAEGRPVTVENDADGLVVNGATHREPSPGVGILCQTLASLNTTRVQLPGGMESRHWREFAEILASAPALFPTPAHLLQALRKSLPSVEIWGATGSLAGSGPRGPEATDGAPTQPGLSNRGAALGSFSAQLSHLHAAGAAAVQHEDDAALVQVLLDFAALETDADPAQIAVVGQERRRVVSPAVLDRLVAGLTRPGASELLARALVSLGSPAAERMLEAVGEASNPRDRQVLTEALEQVPDLPSLLMLALRGGSPALAAGAAELIGKQQMAEAIPALAGMLRHGNAEVRTAAWRALEEIGTREAIEALSSRGR